MKPETTLQILIVETLSILAARHKFVFFSVPNEAYQLGMAAKAATTRDHARMMTLKKMGLTPGVSDLIVLHNGRAFCLEVKTGTGRQSAEQVTFQTAVERIGVPYQVVRSVDEAIETLITWEVIA